MSSGAVLLAMVAAWVVASFGDERSPGFPASLIAFALALTGAWHLCRSNRLPTVTRGLGLTTGLSLAGLASIALGGWAPYAVQQAWRAHEIAWYRGMVPASLGVERALAIDVENRITEGCGVAVFQLSRGTVSRLTLNGLAELGLARQARDHHDGRHTYSQWRKTPFVETGSWVDDRWTYATNCATHMDRQLIDSIGTALHSPGSYYASIHEAGLLVVPSLGLVVFLLHG